MVPVVDYHGVVGDDHRRGFILGGGAKEFASLLAEERIVFRVIFRVEVEQIAGCFARVLVEPVAESVGVLTDVDDSGNERDRSYEEHRNESGQEWRLPCALSDDETQNDDSGDGVSEIPTGFPERFDDI